jgi:hypothetical protein
VDFQDRIPAQSLIAANLPMRRLRLAGRRAGPLRWRWAPPARQKAQSRILPGTPFRSFRRARRRSLAYRNGRIMCVAGRIARDRDETGQTAATPPSAANFAPMPGAFRFHNRGASAHDQIRDSRMNSKARRIFAYDLVNACMKHVSPRPHRVHMVTSTSKSSSRSHCSCGKRLVTMIPALDRLALLMRGKGPLCRCPF